MQMPGDWRCISVCICCRANNRSRPAEHPVGLLRTGKKRRWASLEMGGGARMNDYLCSEIQCPFYRSMDRKQKKIICEGLEDQSNITLGYRKPEAWKRQLEVFCCGRYQACEIHTAIMEAKYADE